MNFICKVACVFNGFQRPYYISPKRRYTTTTEELIDLVDTLSKDFDNVGICWDVEHSEIMQMDISKQLQLVGKRLKATHISDYISRYEDHLLPFSGDTDWRNVQFPQIFNSNANMISGSKF